MFSRMRSSGSRYKVKSKGPRAEPFESSWRLQISFEMLSLVKTLWASSEKTASLDFQKSHENNFQKSHQT